MRDKKLSFMLQLGPSLTQSLTSYASTQMLSTLINRASLGREAPKAEIGPSDRHPFSLIPLVYFSELRHFGGALQEDQSLPRNYVSFTAAVDSKRAPFVALSGLALASLERNILSKSIFDFTLVLLGDQPDEIPERALSSVRHVHLDVSSVIVYRTK